MIKYSCSARISKKQHSIILIVCFFCTTFSFGCTTKEEPEPSNCEVYTIEEIESVQTDGIYPKGKNFPILLYAVAESELKNIGSYGFNIAHIYRLPPQTPITYINACKINGILTHTLVPYNRAADRNTGVSTAVDSVTYANYINESNLTQNVSWWDMPEELRYWKVEEYSMLKTYSKWTKIIDPEKKPVYMYIPGHYKKDDILPYVRYLDVIPASCYVEYMNKPRTYVRYQIENIFKAMAQLKEVEGRDYLNGEKTVVAILELYKYDNSRPVTPEGIHHDFWQALACGAKGIAVYSHAYRNYFPEAWNQLCLDVSNFMGIENLDQVVLYAQVDTNVSFTVTDGDQMAAPMIVQGESDVTYPSLNIRAFNVRTADGNCQKYIIAVNSSASPITAKIKRVLNTSGKAEVLFEERDDLQIINGEFTDTFDRYGVHIYKVF